MPMSERTPETPRPTMNADESQSAKVLAWKLLEANGYAYLEAGDIVEWLDEAGLLRDASDTATAKRGAWRTGDRTIPSLATPEVVEAREAVIDYISEYPRSMKGPFGNFETTRAAKRYLLIDALCDVVAAVAAPPAGAPEPTQAMHDVLEKAAQLLRRFAAASMGEFGRSKEVDDCTETAYALDDLITPTAAPASEALLRAVSGRSLGTRTPTPLKPFVSEDRCMECEGPNVVWFAPSPLWNLVMGGPEAKGDPGGIICPMCFAKRAEAAGVDATGWRFAPEFYADPSPAGTTRRGRWTPEQMAKRLRRIAHRVREAYIVLPAGTTRLIEPILDAQATQLEVTAGALFTPTPTETPK